LIEPTRGVHAGDGRRRLPLGEPGTVAKRDRPAHNPFGSFAHLAPAHRLYEHRVAARWRRPPRDAAAKAAHGIRERRERTPASDGGGAAAGDPFRGEGEWRRA